MSRHSSLTLPGAVVVVTGGGRGIGRATAEAFAAAGARVAVGDVDADLARETAGRLGAGSFGGQLDVTDRPSYARFLDEVGRRLGPVDVLVSNAGIMPLSPLLEEPDEVSRRIVDVNLHGVILGAKLVAPGMAARGRGHLVNVASAVGRLGLAGGATYSASKFAVVGFSEAIRAELAPSGVDVSCVLPVVVTTELGAGLGGVRGQRPVTPEQVAATIVAVTTRPRLETWVPRRAQALFVGASLLPRPLKDGLSRLLGADAVLVDPDQRVRAGYEARSRR